MPITPQSDRSVAPPPLDAGTELKQRRRMLAALVLLLLALVVVAYKNFHGAAAQVPATDAEGPVPGETPAAPATAVSQPATATLSSPPPRKHAASARSTTAGPAAAPGAQSAPLITATNRAVLPALEVQVVAGDRPQTVNARNNAVKVDMRPGSPARPAESDLTAGSPPPSAAPPASAAEQVQMSSTAEVISHKEPVYPTLARQTKVQGSVVLQALIGKDGLIQDLRVQSGPGILASAAQEAVKQWRFKPYLQNGQPVETQCNITVNFTISTQ